MHRLNKISHRSPRTVVIATEVAVGRKNKHKHINKTSKQVLSRNITGSKDWIMEGHLELEVCFWK